MRSKHIKAAAHAHTNLNTFGAVVALLEGGLLYGGNDVRSTSWRIIRICKKEMQRQLFIYERELAKAEASPHG